MSQLPSISKMGYYPFPAEFLDAAARLIEPANFYGAIGFDLTAGEGDAIAHLSNSLKFTPYVNEYDWQRADKCTEKFGYLQSMKGDIFDLDVSHRAAHYGWINPPFQQSGAGTWGRTELNFFVEQMKYYVPGAVVQFICYTQHLANEEMAKELYRNLEDIRIFQCPGQHIDSYQLMVVTGYVRENKTMRLKDEKAAMLLSEQAESHYKAFRALRANPLDIELAEDLHSMFPNIMDVTEPLYQIREYQFPKYFRFHFATKNMDWKVILKIAAQSLPSIAVKNPMAVTPQEIKHEQRVVIQPRVRQIQALIAAGLINNFVIDTPEGLAVIRAVTRQIETEVKAPAAKSVDDPEGEIIPEVDENGQPFNFDSDGDDLNAIPDPDKKPDVIVTRFITAPKTTITLLYQSGRVDNITEDDKLAAFIGEHAEEIMTFIQKNFVPDYKFDFVEGKLTGLLASYRIPKTDKAGKLHRNRPYAAQKHVVAAGYAKLSKDKALIIAGEMGVGKTAIAAMLMDTMRPRVGGQYLDVFNNIPEQSKMRPDQFNIVLSPPHLINKWVAEIKGMFPKAYVGVIASGTGVKPIVAAMHYIKGIDDQPVDAMKVLVISREMVKVGETWEPAYVSQRDYLKLVGAVTTDAQFITENDMKNLLAGNPSSPTTGDMLEKWQRGGSGVAYTAEKLGQRRHHHYLDYAWSGTVNRAQKYRPYPRQDERLKTAAKQDSRARAAGIPEDYVRNMLDEIRQGRIEYDARNAPLNFIWQEARDTRGAASIGSRLAERLGLKPKKVMVRGRVVESKPYVMPLPDVVKGNLNPAEFKATHMKHPRAGIQGLAKFLAQYYSDRIYMLVADEVHEYAAGDDSSQGLALLRLAGAASKLVYMTGTLYKGVASSLYFIEFTTNEAMRRKYPWGKVMEFVRKMGVLERVVKVRSGVDGKNAKKETKSERVTEKPGCAAELLEQVIDHTIFLSIEEVGADIPPRTDRATPVYVTPEMAKIYREAEGLITTHLNTCLALGDSSFLGGAFHALMNWLNWPFDEYRVIHRRFVTNRETGKREMEEYLVCVIPAVGTQDVMTNKDKVVIDAIKQSLKAGRGVALYFHQTGLHANKSGKDILKRFENLLKLHVPEARPAILRHTVQTTKREAWLEEKVAAGMNVLLCNPNLVKTGLDLIWAKDIMWYELDYSLPTVDQASSRAKRIGQDSETSVTFFFNVLPPPPPKVIVKTNINGITLTGISDMDELKEAGLIPDNDDPFASTIDNLFGNTDWGQAKPEDAYTSDWPESWEADESAGSINDVLEDLGLEAKLEEQPLVPIGDFAFNTMEAQGILIVDKKRAAARFLYGQGGGSLASVSEQSKTLAEELAEAVSSKQTKIMSAGQLFQQAMESEAVDEEMSSDYFDPFGQEEPDEIMSATKVFQVKKARRPWTPKKKQYIPNEEEYNKLLTAWTWDGEEIEQEPEPVIEQTALPEPEPVIEMEMVFEEVKEPEPEYPIIVRSMDMRGDKWKDDLKKNGKPEEVEPPEAGATKGWLFKVANVENAYVLWFKHKTEEVERRAMVKENGNFRIVGVAIYK